MAPPPSRIDLVINEVVTGLDALYRDLWSEESRRIARARAVELSATVGQTEWEEQGIRVMMEILRGNEVDPNTLFHEGHGSGFDLEVLCRTIFFPYLNNLYATVRDRDLQGNREPISNTPSGADAVQREPRPWRKFRARLIECYPDLDTTGSAGRETDLLQNIDGQVCSWAEKLVLEIGEKNGPDYMRSVRQMINRFSADFGMGIPEDDDQFYEEMGNRWNDVMSLVLWSAFIMKLRGELGSWGKGTKNWIYVTHWSRAPSSLPFCISKREQVAAELTHLIIERGDISRS